MGKLQKFLHASNEHSIFLLKGYAGTGKSSLVGAFSRYAVSLGVPVQLLAPTGRAAKVLEGYCGMPAYTIHRTIYRAKSGASFDSSGTSSSYDVGYNRQQQGTIYIVDEASMISNSGEGFTPFGSGHLLDDLMEYCFSIDGSRLLLIGDDAQLPPVGVGYSPALSEDYLMGYTPSLYTAGLTEIVRQEAGEIVLTGYELRTLILRLSAGKEWQEPLLSPPETGGEITFTTNEELPSLLEESYRKVGKDETIVLTRTNLEAEALNQGIRYQSLYLDEEVTQGEQIMVVRNNYLHYPTDEMGKPTSGFIANGELLRVTRTWHEEELYGFRFRDAELEDSRGDFVSGKIILDSLYSGVTALTPEQRETLFNNVSMEYPEETTKRGLFQKLRKDPYLNALQIKYAYAMTVHKAQGGGWKNVFLSFGYLTPEMIDLSFCRWLYTAITRATEHLYIISPPPFVFGEIDTLVSGVRYVD